MPKLREVLDYTVIPAQPGFTLWWIDEDELIAPTPITGWVIERRRTIDLKDFHWFTYPVACFDVADEDGAQEYAIQYPDGQVEFPFDHTEPNLTLARDHLRRRAALEQRSKEQES